MSLETSIAVLGSTGTIGENTLEIVRRFPQLFKVKALTAGRNIEKLKTQIAEFNPEFVCVTDSKDLAGLQSQFSKIKFNYGEEGLKEAVEQASTVVVGIMGFAALTPTLHAIKKSKKIGLANKESLIVAGHLLREEWQKADCEIIPVDSEHNGLFQLLLKSDRSQVKNLILTASGGPFYSQPQKDFSKVTVEEAIAHPNWKMGPKISVDSATLMNKGLEVVEAHYLFSWPLDAIKVWIHPQSVLHGAIQFSDNTFHGQFSKPDMKASIGYALGYPERMSALVDELPHSQKWEFSKPDTKRFPCLELPRNAVRESQSHLIALNAANEVAVQLFLEKKIKFSDISAINQTILEKFKKESVDAIEKVYAVDLQAREETLLLSQSF